MYQTRPKLLAVMIDAAFMQGIPLMIWGQPGIAKSEIVKQCADKHNAHLICLHLSQFDSVDLRGVPAVIQGEGASKMTQWNPPMILPFKGNPNFEEDPKKPIFIFLDELAQAMHAVQAPAMQLVLERKIGEHVLMDNVYVLAASNRETDKSGANRMLAALCNRFRHVQLEPNLSDWREWAAGPGKINEKLIAFMEFRPDLLSTFYTKDKTVTGDKAYATPRSWANVSKALNDPNLSQDMIEACIIADVGAGPAAELISFLELFGKIPDMDALIANPTDKHKAPVPHNEPGMLFAISAALVQRANDKTHENILIYADRMPPDYGVRTIKDILRKNPKLSGFDCFTKYAAKHQKLFKRQ